MANKSHVPFAQLPQVGTFYFAGVQLMVPGNWW